MYLLLLNHIDKTIILHLFSFKNAHPIIIKIKLFIIIYKMENNKIIVNSGLSDNINIQNAFAELINNNHSVENSLYWINEY